MPLRNTVALVLLTSQPLLCDARETCFKLYLASGFVEPSKWEESDAGASSPQSLRPYHNCVNHTAPPLTPTPEPPTLIPAASLLSVSGSCPGIARTTHVALNPRDATAPLLLTMQSASSTTKDVSFQSVGPNGSTTVWALPWASNSPGSYAFSSATAFAGPLAVVGYWAEDRQRDAVVNGTEQGVMPVTGAALLLTGVEVGGDRNVHVAAQTVLAHPTGPSSYSYGYSVAIVELEEGVEYHVAIGTAPASGVGVVHMYSVAAGGGGGWGSPDVTQLTNLTAPWDWGPFISSLAARGATTGGRAALVVGTYGDPRCGVTDAWPDTCFDTGSAHVYTVNSSGAWAWNGTLKAPAAKAPDTCGASVAIAGDVVVVGCYWDESPSTNVDIGENVSFSFRVGSAHAWRLDDPVAPAATTSCVAFAATATKYPNHCSSIAAAAFR